MSSSIDVYSLCKQRLGFTDDELENLRNPDISDCHDPFKMKGMKECVDFLRQHLSDQVVIVPDYDADGIGSGVVMNVGLSFLLDKQPFLYKPRLDTGYGLSCAVVDEILNMYPDVQVLVTCDNGIKAFDGIAYAKSKGLFVLVTDHHKGSDVEPIFDAGIDPNRVGCSYPFKGLSGTAVVWKFLSAYAQIYLVGEGRRLFLSILDDLLFFVGLTTVSDVMPVLDENRYFLKQALLLFTDVEFKRSFETEASTMSYLRNHQLFFSRGYHAYVSAFFGVFALYHTFEKHQKLRYSLRNDLRYRLDETFFGFYLAPLLNAPRRMYGVSDVGFNLFLQSLRYEADLIAERLYALNELRKQEMSDLFLRVREYIPLDCVGLCTVTDFSRPGFAGLLAGKLASDLRTPVVCFSLPEQFSGVYCTGSDFNVDDDIIVHGSVRNGGVGDVEYFLQQVYQLYPDCFAGPFGGHKGAAGVAIYLRHFKTFSEAFSLVVTNYIQDVALKPDDGLFCESDVDYLLSVGSFSDCDVSYDVSIESWCDIIDFLDQLRPFGQEFRTPLFKLTFQLSDVTVYRMGSESQHIKLILPHNIVLLDWNRASDWFDTLSSVCASTVVSVYGTLGINEFRNQKTVQFVVSDFFIV